MGTTEDRSERPEADKIGGADPALVGVDEANGRPHVVEVTARPQEARRLSRRRIVLRRFLRNKTAVVGAIGLLLLVLIALITPRLLTWSYTDIDDTSFLQPPGGTHPWGTTQAGRDVMALTVEGLRKSLMIGFAVALLQTFIAALIGALAAYWGGLFDKVALWFIDLLLVVPSFLLIAIISRMGINTGAPTLVLIGLLVAFGWMLSARVVRSMTLAIRDLDYVKAARYMNVPTLTIVFRHLIPNISSLLVIDAALGVAGAVLAETSLSFFGFGVQAPETSLGTMIGEGQRMVSTYPWIFTAPAIALTSMLVFVNFVGDGLRDALDPSSKAGGNA